MIKAIRMAAKSYSSSPAPNTRSCRSKVKLLFSKRCQSRLLSSTFCPSALMSSTALSETLTHSGHGLSWASLELLVKELLDLPLLCGIFHLHGSLERSQQMFHTCSHSLTSAFVCTRRASNLVQLDDLSVLLSLSQSSGIAIELRERSRRQAFLSQIKLNVTQIALPLALVAIPRWDAIP